MDKHFKLKHAVSALLFAGMASAASVASAQAVVNGGGATLPQQLYNEEIGITGAPLFPFRITEATDTWLYQGAGSGAGRDAFRFNDSQELPIPGARVTVHFAGSDAPLLETEYDDYIAEDGLGALVGSNTADGHGRMIQVPMAATPVIIYAKSASGPLSVELTNTHLCGIFGGVIDNWQQIDGSLPDEQITVVYRTESSGTTTLLTQHLAAACVNEDTGAATFAGQGTFADAFGGVPNLPPNFVPATGSGGVQAELGSSTRPEQVAYLSPDPAYAPPSNVAQAQLVNHQSGLSYLPTAAAVNTALAAALVAPAGTLNVDPTDGDYKDEANPAYPLNWVAIVADPEDGYPIVGTTNLLVSQCYDSASRVGTNKTEAERAVSDYLDAHYANTARISAHGLVPLPPTFVADIQAAFTTGSDFSGQLAIGNFTYCNTVQGRNGVDVRPS